MAMNKGFFITRDKGEWFMVSPFRRVKCLTVNEAIKLMMN